MISTDRNHSASGLKSAGYKLNPLSSVMLTAPVASVLSLGFCNFPLSLSIRKMCEFSSSWNWLVHCPDNGKYLECHEFFAFLDTAFCCQFVSSFWVTAIRCGFWLDRKSESVSSFCLKSFDYGDPIPMWLSQLQSSQGPTRICKNNFHNEECSAPQTSKT